MSHARTATQRGLHVIARRLAVRDLTCGVAPGSAPCLDLAWQVEHPAYRMSQETLLAWGSFRLCCWRLFYSFTILSSMRIWRGKQKVLEKCNIGLVILKMLHKSMIITIPCGFWVTIWNVKRGRNQDNHMSMASGKLHIFNMTQTGYSELWEHGRTNTPKTLQRGKWK